MKTVSDDMVRRRVLRTGDGSHRYSKEAKQKTAKELVQAYNERHNEEEEERLRQNVARIRDHYWGWGKCSKFIYHFMKTSH